jgi:hypothetical protein
VIFWTLSTASRMATNVPANDFVVFVPFGIVNKRGAYGRNDEG